MSNYDFPLDLISDNANADIIARIRPNTRVLEFGPARGRMTKHLKEGMHCSVDIVEIDETSGKIAAQYARNWLIGETLGDIENFQWVSEFGGNQYDYIVFADVLEHLHRPEIVLQKCRNLLKDTGSILCSIPNICHASVILSMLMGEFQYTDTGLLDSTHVHFFTENSFRDLSRKCGFNIVYEHGIVVHVGNNEIPYDYSHVTGETENLIRQRTNSEVYQYVFELKRVVGKSVQDSFVVSTAFPATRICTCLFKGKDDVGFSDYKKCTKAIVPQKVEVEFDLKDFPGTESVYTTLLDCNGIVKITRISCFGDKKELIEEYDSDNIRLAGNLLCSFDRDISICFFLPKNEEYQTIRFEYEVLIYNSDVLRIIGQEVYPQIEEMREHLLRQLQEARSSAKTWQEDSAEKAKQLQAAVQSRIAFEEQCKRQNNELMVLYQHIEDTRKSISYRCAAPIRFVGRIFRGVKRRIARFINLLCKTGPYMRQYGAKATFRRIKNHKAIAAERTQRHDILEKIVQNEEIWTTLERWIDETPCKFIDIFGIPMGWNTPLFQRFQHISLQVGNIGGISFYGAHPQVDQDVDTYRFVTSTLCVVNLLDPEVADRFWKILDCKSKLKYVRVQSIDLATTIEDVKSYISRGYQIVYEYIDELSPQITGNIPKFVYDRHEYLLRNEDVTVIATSDKLFSQVKPYRKTNMLMLNNGVDYAHWHLNRSEVDCPEDIRHIVNQGKIIIGYHGALAQWIDYKLLCRLADDKRFILLLIGHEHDDNLNKSGLLKRENVYYIGPRSYHELNRYCIFYDIAILPFVINDITLSVSPVKIFEYMAANKPVVTYMLPECQKYKSCLCAETADEFVAQVEKAIHLRDNKEYIDQLRKDALDNTWISIAEKMVEYVKVMYLRRQKLLEERRVLSSMLSVESKNELLTQMLLTPKYQDETYCSITDHPYERRAEDCKVIAYYLTQFHPDAHNELWWGRGVTEWNNVCRAVPQYVGHYQPRIPGELGYYDLRIMDNMKRQIELAKMYGIYGFSFYYYWFDGERLLERPLEAFLQAKELEFPFCICWANENWTKRFDGTNQDILMEQPKSVESYRNVIHDMMRFLKDGRYIEVCGKKLITVYRPSLMPEHKRVLRYWREQCREQGLGELYIMAVKENMIDVNWLDEGFDAVTEFHPGTLYTQCHNITNRMSFLRRDFAGEVFSYRDIVIKQKYFNYDYSKLYRAVMPMWDNTARRDYKGMIFDGSTPKLYKQWLKDVIQAGYTREDIEDNIIFINAWNEWGEGAYMEPDKRYGYAYLQATKEAIEETRNWES